MATVEPDLRQTANTAPRAFVIGDPVAHSKSPAIHGRWLRDYAIAGSYEAIHVKPDALRDFLARLRDGAFVGGNVTIPHKEDVLALCDRLDDAANAIGAVNTLVRQADGTITGANTDHYGFLANLDDRAPGWDARHGRALVLGAGGAARAIVFALAARGFDDVIVLNRTQERARSVADAFGVRAEALDAFATLAPETDLVVNTTAVGMHGSRFDTLDLGLLPPSAFVTDIVYTPLETPLLADARARALATADGLGMLLHQAVPGFAAWFGHRPEVTEALRADIVARMG